MISITRKSEASIPIIVDATRILVFCFYGKFMGEKVSCIYAIVSKHNGKIYIGSTVDFNNRVKGHLRSLTNKKHDNKRLQNHYNKYGKDDLEFFIVEIVPETDFLLWREQFYINCFGVVKNGFNISPTAGNNFGYRHTDETKELLRNLAVNMSEEQREKLRNAQLGRKYSQETKDKLTLLRKGKKLSQHHIDRIRESRKNMTYIPNDKTRKLWSEQRKGKQCGKDNPFYDKKHSKESIDKMKLKLVGRKQSPEEIKNRADKIRGRVRISKNGETKLVFETELNNFLRTGWVLGFHSIAGRKCVNKNGIEKRIPVIELSDYIKNGWNIGRLNKVDK